MSFPSMSIQRLIKLSSIIVDPIMTQHFCRRESHGPPPAELLKFIFRRESAIPISTHFDRFLSAKNDGIYSVALKRACDLY